METFQAVRFGVFYNTGSASHEGDYVDTAGAGAVYRGNLDKLITKIDAERGIDLGNYRRQYLERRLAARLRSLGLHSYRQYSDFLDREPAEYEELLNALTINVTDFYRDKTVFDIFRSEIVPQMIDEKTSTRHRMIRVWSAGCATGEEPYSITMSFLDALGEREREFLLTVLGTDLDPEALAKARAAEYQVDKLGNIPLEHQVRYLEKHGQTFSVRPEVTRHVKFRQMNLFSERPMTVVDVIFCRNVFIYFSREQQAQVLEQFWGALARGGFLVLGRSEKLAASVADRFELYNGRERIYRKPKSV